MEKPIEKDLSKTVNPNTVLFITAIASFSTPFMLSSINIAMPAISHDLNMSALGMGWISLSFLLASTVLLVPLGRAADLYGRKKIFTTGFIIFTLTSLFCALARTPWQLIMFRTLQGLGSSMIFGTAIAILTSVYPPDRRGRALGMVSASVYLGLSLGPFLGGILVQQFSWRGIFYFNVPIGLLVLYLLFTRIKGDWRGVENETFDLKGSLIYSASLVALMYGASAITTPRSPLLVLAGIAGFVWFFRHETRTAYPVLNARMFLKNNVFAFSSLAALLNYCASFAISFLLSLYLQYVKGLSPQQAGVIMVCQPVFMVLFSPAAGRLSDRIEPRIVASWGMALTTAGLLFFSRINAMTPMSIIIAGLCVLGLGLAFFSSPNTNAVMTSVEARSYSLASALLATMRVGGQTLSMAIVMLLFSLMIGQAKIGPENLDQFVRSFRLSIYIFSALSFLGIFASLKRGNVR
ncbi:MAG: MFS transporter [Elusimicrobia bacterium RIFOXYA12_FULL_51_18]|nr:MAG: MFS transporter [Elusimicrobia bacterium RIFOXYA12_FULL_51_18]OGS29437.1 MAG: MFS transporter [Elusimicrobia bacterium RIFOXYA2_FULL_53_38]